jgi:predicted RNA-binding Zn-ribbon protein involved in translation (DUF1610 family)
MDYFDKHIKQLKREAAFCEKHGHTIGKVNRVHGANVQYKCAKCGHEIWYLQDEPLVSMKPQPNTAFSGRFATWLFGKLSGSGSRR